MLGCGAFDDGGTVTDVVVIGAGAAGLAVAHELNRAFGMSVIVVEREQRAAGTEHAVRAGIGVRLGTQVVSVQSSSDGSLQVNTVGVGGPDRVAARAVVLATGCRERTQSGRLIPGARLRGVLTATELRHTKAVEGPVTVVLGADDEAFAAMRVLRLAGGKARYVVTPWHRHQASWWSFWVARLLHLFTLRPNAYVTRVLGTDRLTGVELTYRDGSVEHVACDTLLLTGDWVPEYELAMRAGLLMDRATGGPATDTGGRTSRKAMFATGSLTRPGARGDLATADSSAVANAVADYLATGEWFRGMPINLAAPIDWISPALAMPSESDAGFVLSATAFRDSATVAFSQGERQLGSYAVPSTAPGIPFGVPGDWCLSIDADGPEINVSLT